MVINTCAAGAAVLLLLSSLFFTICSLPLSCWFIASNRYNISNVGSVLNLASQVIAQGLHEQKEHASVSCRALTVTIEDTLSESCCLRPIRRQGTCTVSSWQLQGWLLLLRPSVLPCCGVACRAPYLTIPELYLVYFGSNSCCNVGSHVTWVRHDGLDEKGDCLQAVVVACSISGFERCRTLLWKTILISKQYTISFYVDIAQLPSQAELLQDS